MHAEIVAVGEGIADPVRAVRLSDEPAIAIEHQKGAEARRPHGVVEQHQVAQARRQALHIGHGPLGGEAAQ